MVLTDMRGERLTGIDPEGWRWVIRWDSIRLTPATSYTISELHAKNGLIDDVVGGNSVPASRVAEEVFNVINGLADSYTLHPAGTNVDFDIRWIRSLGLQLANLHYRRLDLTALRMLMQHVPRSLGEAGHRPQGHDLPEQGHPGVQADSRQDYRARGRE